MLFQLSDLSGDREYVYWRSVVVLHHVEGGQIRLVLFGV